MKKSLLLLFILLGSALLSLAQQRLVTLPGMEAGGQGLASLCIDLFRDAPSGERYRVSESGSHIDVDDFRNVNLPPGPPSSHPQFLFPEGEHTVIPEYYKKFIRTKIEEYRPGFNASRQEQLQNEVWAFNGMDHLGYINRTAAATDPVAAFEAKKPAFLFKFNLETEDAAVANKMIVDKAEQLHLLSEDPVPLPLPTDIHLTGAHISCHQNGQLQRIAVEYSGVTFAAVKDEAAIDGKILSYYNTYHQLPDKAEFSSSTKPTVAILTFSGDGDLLGSYDMNFRVPNNTGIGIRDVLTSYWAELYCYKR